MRLIDTLIATTLSLASAAVFAQAASSPTATPRVDQRQANQQQRIEQGKASGELTKPEAHRLQHQQRHIQHAENMAKADGTVTTAERKHLHHMQDNASRRIHQQKHDAQHRGAAASGAAGQK
jgi:hypothetical protein